jgi:hypothetical protein
MRTLGPRTECAWCASTLMPIESLAVERAVVVPSERASVVGGGPAEALGVEPASYCSRSWVGSPVERGSTSRSRYEHQATIAAGV